MAESAIFVRRTIIPIAFESVPSATRFELRLQKSTDFAFDVPHSSTDAVERQRALLEAKLRQQMEMTAALDRDRHTRWVDKVRAALGTVLDLGEGSSGPVNDEVLPRVRHVLFGSEPFLYVRFRKNVAFIKDYGFRPRDSQDEVDALAIATHSEAIYRKTINRAIILGAKTGRLMRRNARPADCLDSLAQLLRRHPHGTAELVDLYLPETKAKVYYTARRPADLCQLFAGRGNFPAVRNDPQHVVDCAFVLSALLANTLESDFGGHCVNYGFHSYFVRASFSLRLMDLAEDKEPNEADIEGAGKFTSAIKRLLRQKHDSTLENIEIEPNKRYYRNFSSTFAIVSGKDGASTLDDPKAVFEATMADLTAVELRLQTVRNRLFAINSYLDYTDKKFRFEQYKIFSDALDDARAFDASAVQPRFVEYLNGINRDGALERQATRLRQRLQIHNDIQSRAEAQRKEGRSISFNAIVTFFCSLWRVLYLLHATVD